MFALEHFSCVVPSVVGRGFIVTTGKRVNPERHAIASSGAIGMGTNGILECPQSIQQCVTEFMIASSE
jgi:hypothetical protein